MARIADMATGSSNAKAGNALDAHRAGGFSALASASDADTCADAEKISGTVRIGTRGSALALWQAEAVAQALRATFPQIAVETCVIRTQGDVNLSTSLAEIGDKGLFTKELERALLAADVDVCVHSMKDMPSQLPKGCEISGMLPRADARDVLVCGPRIEGCRTLASLPAGSRVGTGSLRRAAQIAAANPGVSPVSIRGNIQTRLDKATGADYEGAVMAAAGIERMGLQRFIAAYLPIREMVPAVGQGAIGMETRTGDARTRALVAAVSHAQTCACVEAERHVLGVLEGGCQVPIGAYARYEDGRLAFDAIVASTDGTRIARASRTFDAATPPMRAAEEVLAELRRQGAEEILAEIRGASAPAAGWHAPASATRPDAGAAGEGSGGASLRDDAPGIAPKKVRQ